MTAEPRRRRRRYRAGAGRAASRAHDSDHSSTDRTAWPRAGGYRRRA
ncbi:MAG: hypothetical protein MZW92_45505 [Comamonadaceae bacterium]|nr:hypothetical protein [Comamonadaceae bacterium]